MIFTEIIDGQKLSNIKSGTIVRNRNNSKIIKGLNNTAIALDDEVFSKHILALGSIGSGKSNVMYHISQEILSEITSDDIVVFFDAKGDYLKEFYRDGDIVIGNKNN